MDGMTGRERFYAHMTGAASDRPAVINPVSAATAESCDALGLRFEEVHLDADKMAALAAYSYEKLGFDCVMPHFSVVQEAAALGARIDWGGRLAMPTQRSHVFSDPDEVRVPEDFLDRPAIKTVLDAVKLLKRRCPDALLIGKAMGPWTLSLHLYGLEDTLVDTIEEPERISAMLAALSEFTRVFAQAQLLAGADVVTIADHVTSNLVGPESYVRFVQLLHQKLIGQLGADRLILHCCGYTLDRIAHFRDAGFGLYHFESANDVKKAVELAGGMKLTGCVNNPTVLLAGGPDDVMAQAGRILRDGVSILSPECAVPLQVKNENLRAISRAAAAAGL